MLRFSLRAQVDAAPIGDLDARTSRLLRGRGITTPEAAARFLSPSLDQLHDPFLMPDMAEAVRLIRAAASAGDPIVVYGDYDCDGVCAAAILTETLREMGASVSYRIPDRHRDGYGLNEEQVRSLAGAGCRLLITVDCGISNLREVAIARRELGMAVIVTDHHQIGEALPEANAVLNPLRPGYPFPRLCGAGVAFKLTQALLGASAAAARLDLAALATVADLVPLIDENRAIVAAGLSAVRDTKRPGLRCLLDLANIEEGEAITSTHLGYRIGPRINAGGRLGDAGRCVELLLTRDEGLAASIAAALNDANTQRQALQAEITRQAEEKMAEATDFRTDRAIVVMGDGWESGVIGLAAGRLCEKYHWPAIVLSRNAETGLSVGSCRSIPGVNIFRALSLCSEAAPDLFKRFGGHEQAAGLTIDADRLDELRSRLNAAIDALLGGDRSCYLPEALYDDTLPAADVTLALVDSLARFEPTGFGNPAPVFLSAETRIGEAKAVGHDKSHLKLTLLSDDGTRRIDGISFGKGDLCGSLHSRADLLFSPAKNVFQGRVSPQATVHELRPSAGALALPEENLLRAQLLQEITWLAENIDSFEETDSAPIPFISMQQARNLLASGIGVLAVAHSRSRAAALSAVSPAPDLVRAGEMPDARGFAAVAVHGLPGSLPDCYEHVILADGDLLPGEAEALRRHCPYARLHRLEPSQALAAEIAGWLPGKDLMRAVFVAARESAPSLTALAERTGAGDAMQLRAALTALRECGLLEWQEHPWQCRVISAHKCDPTDTPIIRYLGRIGTDQTGEDQSHVVIL